ncbi:murein biosynthesis integral membrane protein MurJ [Corynebacterium sp.]|uniref:murein biosynthesis integral membrane protein MurJ n=1 Tax=Corynebacterium sp. TaxID=1720 RepID=UPI0026DD8A88|nr:murein biosynthesis integral membrane protein MurJ [Corynebacterium sp.]MDO5077622.1 murein biosynthesis integral membrane protein MurJ [Corynebacterium sp.]
MNQNESWRRSRIIAPAPPAPAVKPKPQVIEAIDEVEENSDGDVVRSTGSMAIATLCSRITGFLRTVAISSTLGAAVASAFNAANTLPNLITEIVLGAVLTSLVVPVLVRAEKEDEDRGAFFIRRLFTLSFTLLLVVTAISLLTAPLITTLQLGSKGQVNLSQATSIAYLVLPQILFYGIFSLFTAVLNTKGVFRPGAWAPVINNVICLAVFGAYWIVPGKLDPDQPVSITNPHILLLGLGTTLGVVVQALIMLPAMRRVGISLKPLWGIDERLKQFGGMALAIVVYVAISQAGWIIATRIASFSDAAAITIYQAAWLLLQVPYGVIGVTLLTAIMPRLSRNAADGDNEAVVYDLKVATKLTLMALLPIIVFFTAFGRQIAHALFAHGQFDSTSADFLGDTLSYSAFTLIPYALVLLHLRVFYAREEAWTPTFIIAGITGTKVVLSYLSIYVASTPSHVVILLGAANGCGFISGAVIGSFLLRRKLGPLGTREVLRTSLWAIGSALIGALFAWCVDYGISLVTTPTSLWFFVRVAVSGVVFLAVTGVVLSRSGLDELSSLGAIINRIPGLRTTSVEATQLLALDSLSATPGPMSGGLVHGPRLMAGALVLGGRFRLLASHGESNGARFWHARQQDGDREVALVFVEDPDHEIARRTVELGNQKLDGVAPITEVFTDQSTCVVVAEWVPGVGWTSIQEASPRAAAHALKSLATAQRPLGIDSPKRLRITSEGKAILAFPAVVSTGPDQLDSALHSIVETEKSVHELLQLTNDHSTIHTVAERTPMPEDQAGFGDGYSRVMTIVIAVATVLVVSITAVATMVLFGP